MNEKLISMAAKLTNKQVLTGHEATAASVGSAILSRGGNIYTGVNIGLTCGLGFCAEASAIAEMLKHGESEIDKIVAVHYTRGIISPCGRCREMMYQVNTANVNAEIILSPDKSATLGELLPLIWLDGE